MRIATIRPAGGGPATLAFADAEGRLWPVADLLTAREAAPDPRGCDWLTPEGLAGLRAVAARCAMHPPADPAALVFCPPVLAPGKIIAVGRNYMDHVREGQELWARRGKVVTIPQYPTAFAKYPSSLTGHNAPIVIPAGLDDVDYEIELAVVIGRPALDVPEETALDHVAGYTICNDVGTRGIQRREMEAQIGIVLAKNFPGFAPMGPWFVTSDEVGDPQTLDIALTVDGEVRQQASTSDMIFSVARLVSYWSRMGLQTGDILITGTPSGVALARPEPEKFYLRAGQTVDATIARIGTLRNVMAASG